MMVALAEKMHKLWQKVATDVELESHSLAQAPKISMGHSAIRNAKQVTPEWVQSAGRTASVTPLTPVLPVPRNLMAELLESQ